MGSCGVAVPRETPICKLKKLASGSTTWTDITGDLGFFEGLLWGIAVDSSDNIYVTEFERFGGKIKKFSNGIWTDITYNGSFLGPRGMAVDSSGNLYVADLLNNKIKKMTP